MTSDGKNIEVDLLAEGEEGVFFIEIKTKKSAERNSGTEINAYSKAINSLNPYFSVKNSLVVLITNFDSGISKESYLYEVIYNKRKLIVYNWRLRGNDVLLVPYIIFRNDLKSFRGDFDLNWVVIDFPEIKDISPYPKSGKYIERIYKIQFAMLCEKLLSRYESAGFSGFMIGKILWHEKIGYHPNQIIFSFLTNPERVKDGEKLRISKISNEFFCQNFILMAAILNLLVI